MPELPEVETVKRGLEGFILGAKLVRVEVLCEKSFIGEPVSGRVVGIRRFGKALVIDLDSNMSLMIHLRMTGQLIWWDSSFKKEESQREEKGMISKSKSAVSDFEIEFVPSFAGGHPSDNYISELPNKQTRVVLEFDKGTLYFNDQRKFGFIKVMPTAEVMKDGFIRKLAKEPWEMSAVELKTSLQRHKQSAVKAVILDQTVICGLGNIYADEALYEAKIHPARKAGSLSLTEVANLLTATKVVMEKSIESGGSTMRNFVKADGSRGNYLDLFAKVYHRDGEPCERCGTKLEKIKVGGRGTYFCPECQRLDTTSVNVVENLWKTCKEGKR